MFLELAEVLDCPGCRASAGLVAFVGRAEARRVLEGSLGCPLCETEVPILGGTIRFDLGEVSPRPVSPSPTTPNPVSVRSPATGPPPLTPSEAELRVAALLDVSGRAGMVVLLGPGMAEHAAGVARRGDRLEAIAWLLQSSSSAAPSPEDLAAGVNPVRGASPAAWPVRSAALHGIAVASPLVLAPSEIARCARSGARLVLDTPTRTDIERVADAGFAEIAADATVWVGERH